MERAAESDKRQLHQRYEPYRSITLRRARTVVESRLNSHPTDPTPTGARSPMVTMRDTIQVLQDVLHLGDSARSFGETTRLLGSIPEFDSMAVVNVVTTIEERFGVIVEDDEISAETFETVGSLHAFLLSKLDC